MPRRLGQFAALLSAIALSAPGHAGAAEAPSFGVYHPTQSYDGIASSSLYLPMRDGVKLALRIERPMQGGKPAEGRFPVIWHGGLVVPAAGKQSATGRVSAFWETQQLVQRGYVVVQVARRGNGQSFGARRGYHDRNEAEDSYEVTQWLAAQPWSTGKVGVYGCSNTGDAAMHVMAMRPPALAAVFAGCFSWHKYDAFRRGGIFAQWGTGPARTVEEDMQVPAIDGDEGKILLRQAAEEHQKSTNLFEMWKGMPWRDSWSPLVGSRFWSEGSVASYADKLKRSGVPLYIVGGWKDELRDQAFITWLNVPGARVVVGPWKHCENEGFTLFDEMLRFYDQALKGIDTGLSGQAPIHYFTSNAPAATAWKSSANWPLPGTVNQSLFLSGGALSPHRTNAKPASFDARYDVKCDAGFGPMAQPCHIAGAGLSFAGAALKADSEVTGNVGLDLWVSANAPDANVFAYLEDIAPDGSAQVVTEGRIKASLRKEGAAPWVMPTGVPWHRAYAEDAQPLSGSTPVELRFAMMPTSWLFKSGHHIQITVTGSDYRERARDLTTPPRITLYADKAHASSVTLPVIPSAPAR
jgi:uncharacterized protein